MSYEIRFHREAERELDRVSHEEFRLLDRKIIELAHHPRAPGMKKLDKDIYRVRQGSWRILYTIDDEQRVVVILRIARRNEHTYKRLP